MAELCLAEVAELAVVHLADGLVKAREQIKTGGRYADENFAAVGIFAATADEGAFFKAIEKASEVGVAGDHAAGDFAAEEAFGGAAEDAEDVVLVRREVVVFEELVGAACEQIGGAHEFDEDGFFRAGSRLFRDTGPSGHTDKMIVGTNKCQRAGGRR